MSDRRDLRGIAAEGATPAAEDRALLAAAQEVDVTLLDWTLSLGPFERLRVCSRAAKALTGWRRVTSEDR